MKTMTNKIFSLVLSASMLAPFCRSLHWRPGSPMFHRVYYRMP